MEKVKHYDKGDFTVVWKPEKCIHSGECVKRLPKVYDPKDRPWVKPENATVEELKSQINHCPSGALTYIENSKSEMADKSSRPNVQITMVKNGPLLVAGDCVLKDYSGKEVALNKSTAFCRCGASSNKPFCDGSHKQIEFVG